ncbi:cutinase family protein [Mycolicibacterium fluoranthenivorans]|jgi:cutinase|uniref:Cutinase n=1 Tax=Mycolicibacterium fluoranthenivorans TaxID=258505 RepID=A0A1G4W8Y6_9MYCO|nr:cutinase family protein [Mycolicibacterium fluoranthenivorans]SCX18680.1 cutinase [Mycolicibacterium fluoranthenivorans]
MSTSARARRLSTGIGALLGVAAAVFTLCAGAPTATAEPCADVDVTFARGTTEPPGLGAVGQAFVDEVRARAGTRTVSDYAVNYPASNDFPTASDGVVDAISHINTMAANCPKTKLVLGGSSQGAAVIGYVTGPAIPPGYIVPAGINGPMSAQTAEHIAAVALFGTPSDGVVATLGAPPVVIGPLVADKTIDICLPGDVICAGGGGISLVHGNYAHTQAPAEAADFVAQRVF